MFTIGQNTIRWSGMKHFALRKVFTSESALREVMVETGLFWAWSIKPTSTASFNHDQAKHVQNGGCQDEAIAQNKQNWGYNEGKCLVEIWADKEVQRQLLAMGKKQNIWENIAAKLNDNGYKRYKLLSLSKTEYLGTEESANAVSSLNYVCTPHLDIYAINMKLPIFIQPCMKRVWNRDLV